MEWVGLYADFINDAVLALMNIKFADVPILYIFVGAVVGGLAVELTIKRF